MQARPRDSIEEKSAFDFVSHISIARLMFLFCFVSIKLISHCVIHFCHHFVVLNSDAASHSNICGENLWFKPNMCCEVATNINRMSRRHCSCSTRPTIGVQSALNCNQRMSRHHHQSLSSAVRGRSSRSSQLIRMTNGGCRPTLSSNWTLTCWWHDVSASLVDGFPSAMSLLSTFSRISALGCARKFDGISLCCRRAG